MNLLIQYMKRNYKLILVVVAVSMGLFAFKGVLEPKGDPEKDKMLLELLTFVIERGHYDPAVIDDNFSKGIYKDYVEALDPSKRFFIQSDIDEFAVYETQIDDQIKNKDLTFFNLTYDRLMKRLTESKEFYKEILAKPFDYNVKEDFMQKQHFGIIIFSKYPIINKKQVSEYPHNYNSIFQYADIVKANDTFRVFNLHLQSLRFTPGNLKYIDKPSMKDEADLEKSKSLISKLKNGFLKRQLQAGRIREEMNKSIYPNIVCGDFNDVPNSYSYNIIGKGMKNTFVEKGSGLGRTFSGISPTLRIDNIFVDKRFSVQQFTRVQEKLSDHYPIVADVKKAD